MKKIYIEGMEREKMQDQFGITYDTGKDSHI